MASYLRYPLGCIHRFQFRARLGSPSHFSIPCHIKRYMPFSSIPLSSCLLPTTLRPAILSSTHSYASQSISLVENAVGQVPIPADPLFLAPVAYRFTDSIIRIGLQHLKHPGAIRVTKILCPSQEDWIQLPYDPFYR